MDAQRLKTVPLFSGLTKRQLGQLAEWIDEVGLPARSSLPRGRSPMSSS